MPCPLLSTSTLSLLEPSHRCVLAVPAPTGCLNEPVLVEGVPPPQPRQHQEEEKCHIPRRGQDSCCGRDAAEARLSDNSVRGGCFTWSRSRVLLQIPSIPGPPLHSCPDPCRVGDGEAKEAAPKMRLVLLASGFDSYIRLQKRKY